MNLLRLLRRPRVHDHGLSVGESPVLTSVELLAAHQTTIDAVRSLVGVPEVHWASLYAELFDRYAGFVQQLPASELHDHAGRGSILAHGLKVMVQAINLRRAKLLPPGAQAEEIARKQDLWTYAVATAALLRFTGKSLLDLVVTLYDAQGRELGSWAPWTGPMGAVGAKRYTARFRQGSRHGVQPRTSLLLVHFILPDPGLRWLATDLELWDRWTAAMISDDTAAGVLGEIAEQVNAVTAEPGVDQGAARNGRSGRHTLSEPRAAESRGSRLGEQVAGEGAMGEAGPTTVAIRQSAVSEDRLQEAADTALVEAPASAPAGSDMGRAFVAWLHESLIAGRIQINGPGARVHVVPEGLLLVSPAVFQDFGRTEWAQVQKGFQKLKLHRKAGGGANIHSYMNEGSSKGGGLIQGFLIPDPAERFPGVKFPPPNPSLRST